MILDFNSAKGLYFLRVPRGEADVEVLRREHGLDFSTSASTVAEAVMMTRDPFAAVTFIKHATTVAKNSLASLAGTIEASWKPDSERHFDIPYGRELWGFQKANLEYMLDRKNTLVGDQPGLGKTETAIAFCNEIQGKRNLVVCPANIRLQWAERIREWSTMRHPYVVYPIIKGSSGVHPKAQWSIISYDLARSPAILNELNKFHYDCLILDEPHYLKEADSLRTRAIFGGGKKAIKPLAACAERIIGLTGTPLPNRPREAFTLAKGLCWDSIDWMNEEKFKTRYNPSMRREIIDPETGMQKFFIDERSGRHYELQNRLRGNFMTRHIKHGPHGVMQQLHLPIYDLIQIEENRAIKQALAAESMLDIDPESLEGADAQTIGHIAVVRHQMGLALAPSVVEYADMLLEGGEDKIVIFAWHVDVLDILQAGLHKYGILRVDGSTTQNGKKRAVEQFRYNPDYRVMIGNTLSLGTGTDGLQYVCNHGIIAEPDWVPGNNVQCFDRLDRGGQRDQVQGDIIVARGSVAEKILAKSLRKGQIIHKTLDDRMW